MNEWNNGSYEFSPGKEGFKFTRQYPGQPTRTVQYDSHNVGPWYQRRKNGLTLDKALSADYGTLGGATTGLPDYTQTWADYWASVPDKYWNRTFMPVPAFRRRHFYGITPPNMPYKEMGKNVDNAFYNGAVGTTVIPRTRKELQELRKNLAKSAPELPNAYYGTPSMRQMTPKAVGDMNMMADLKGHELNHANQMSMWDEDVFQKFNGMSLIERIMHRNLRKADKLAHKYGNPAAAPRMNAYHPVLNEDSEYVAYDDGYYGNGPEEAQAIHSMKDGITALKNTMKERTADELGMTQDEYDHVAGMNQWFRSPEEMQAAVAWLRNHPYVAHMLGTEQSRALGYADEHALQAGGEVLPGEYDWTYEAADLASQQGGIDEAIDVLDRRIATLEKAMEGAGRGVATERAEQQLEKLQNMRMLLSLPPEQLKARLLRSRFYNMFMADNGNGGGVYKTANLYNAISERRTAAQSAQREEPERHTGESAGNEWNIRPTKSYRAPTGWDVFRGRTQPIEVNPYSS